MVELIKVRCKDCKYWGESLSEEERKENANSKYSDLVCSYFMCDGLSGNDYCSKGIKRSEKMYQLRTWKKTALDGWTSDMETFDSKEEAVYYGEQFVRMKRRDELERSYEVNEVKNG